MTFSIRDLLWLVTLFALALGWWLDHDAARTLKQVQSSEIEEWRGRCMTIAEWIRQNGGTAEWSDTTLFLSDADGNSHSYTSLPPHMTSEPTQQGR